MTDPLAIRMQTIEPRAILVGPGVSLDGNVYSDTIAPATAQNFLELASGDITITQ